MNERLPDDELVSSVLDDEADASAHALLDGNPALQQRLASFQRVSTSLGSAPATAQPELREQAIAAALAASPAITAATSGASVTSLSRPSRSPWLLAAAAAAVVVVLLPVGILVAANLGGGGTETGEIATGVDETDDTVSTTPLSTTPTTDANGNPSDGQTGTDGGSNNGRAPGPRRGVVAHLGELSDTTAVATAIANYRSSSSEGSNQSSNGNGSSPNGGSIQPSPGTGTSTPADPAPTEPSPGGSDPTEPLGGTSAESPCPEVVAGSEPVEMVASASYQGTPSVIVVTGGEAGGSAVVVDSSSCEVLAEVPL